MHGTNSIAALQSRTSSVYATSLVAAPTAATVSTGSSAQTLQSPLWVAYAGCCKALVTCFTHGTETALSLIILRAVGVVGVAVHARRGSCAHLGRSAANTGS